MCEILIRHVDDEDSWMNACVLKKLLEVRDVTAIIIVERHVAK